MPDRRLSVVPDPSPEEDEAFARAELDRYRRQITASVLAANPPPTARQRWLRRVARVVQSTRTTVR